MYRIDRSFINRILLALFVAAMVLVNEGAHASTQEEETFFRDVFLPAMKMVKAAMPAAPEGWIVESETKIDETLPEQVSGDILNLRFTYAITYKRVKGVPEETKQLDDALAASKKKYNDTAGNQTGELAKKKKALEQALQTSQKRKESGREKRLQKELDEVTRKLDAIPQDTEQMISQEMEEFLVKDTEVQVRVIVNDSTAAFPDARFFSRPKAAYALKKDEGRIGATGWQTGKYMILYGDWQDAGKFAFRGKVEQKPLWPRAQTIKIEMVGDWVRIEPLFKKINMRSIMSLMKE